LTRSEPGPTSVQVRIAGNEKGVNHRDRINHCIWKKTAPPSEMNELINKNIKE
jgi:hypothetical protein